MKQVLSDTKIRNAKPSEKARKLSDGGGLYLLVSLTGAKSWRLKYRLSGKEFLYVIGQYPAVSLKDARVARDAARALIKEGTHPLQQRRLDALRRSSDTQNTFRAVATNWIEKNAARWSGTYGNQVRRAMQHDVFPIIGDLPIKQVTAAHILAVLKQLEQRGAISVALLVRGWCSQIFRLASANLLVNGDPASALRGAIQRSKVKHHAHIAENELPELLEALSKYAGYRETSIALRLMLYTFVRTSELRKAEWQEFDLANSVWRIPEHRMKMRETHLVPLSAQAVSLLRELQTWSGARPYLFPNHRRPTAPMSATTLNRALERMKYGGRLSAHGFRGTASTILYAHGHPSHVIERQLAHSERNKSKAAYNHAQYFPERVALMQWWADRVDSSAAAIQG